VTRTLTYMDIAPFQIKLQEAFRIEAADLLPSWTRRCWNWNRAHRTPTC